MNLRGWPGQILSTCLVWYGLTQSYYYHSYLLCLYLRSVYYSRWRKIEIQYWSESSLFDYRTSWEADADIVWNTFCNLDKFRVLIIIWIWDLVNILRIRWGKLYCTVQLVFLRKMQKCSVQAHGTWIDSDIRVRSCPEGLYRAFLLISQKNELYSTIKSPPPSESRYVHQISYSNNLSK